MLPQNEPRSVSELMAFLNTKCPVVALTWLMAGKKSSLLIALLAREPNVVLVRDVLGNDLVWYAFSYFTNSSISALALFEIVHLSVVYTDGLHWLGYVSEGLRRTSDARIAKILNIFAAYHYIIDNNTGRSDENIVNGLDLFPKTQRSREMLADSRYTLQHMSLMALIGGQCLSFHDVKHLRLHSIPNTMEFRHIFHFYIYMICLIHQ